MNNLDDKFILDLRIQFCHDSLDLMQNVEAILLDLEKDASEAKIIALKRELHCLKGNARAVGFDELSKISHDIETLCMNKGLLLEKVDGLLQTLDSITEALKDFLRTQNVAKITNLQTQISF